ncbi:MAG: NAD(P)/FAD-dependent oxidoreductase, partial [Pyrinomonadaceae bacterium]
RLEAKLRNIDLDSKTVELVDGSVVQGRAIVIATGVRRRTLQVAGENEFTGRGILTSGAKEKHLVKNARVLIVGGGDAALENALILAEQASKVIVVHRRNEFSARKEFVESAAGKPNVEFKPGRSVKGFFGGDHLSEVEIVDEIGKISRIAVDFALVRIGVQPNIESFRKQIETTSGGYAVVSAEFETSCANVFAIGDVACPNSPTISTAVGSAAIAVKKLKSSVQSSKSNPKI